jgi:hypothetical protein
MTAAAPWLTQRDSNAGPILIRESSSHTGTTDTRP